MPILNETSGARLTAYLIYPKELRRSVRVAVLREFLVSRMTDDRLNGVHVRTGD